MNGALKEVAARLGNTPAVARASYVSPAVIDAFGRGRCLSCSLAPDEVVGRVRGLHPVEEALVALLRASVRRGRSEAVVRLLRGGGRGLGRPAPSSGPTAKPERRAARAPEAPAPRGRP